MSSGPCLKIQARVPEPGTVVYYLAKYAFPEIFAAGLLGSIVNLIVLRKMKSKSNTFLAAMATCDIVFFLAMFIYNLSAYDSLATSWDFLKFYFNVKMTLNAILNCVSSASNWFAVMVSIERLIAMKWPFRARSFWTTQRLRTTIVVIVASSMMLQFYVWLWYTPATVSNCSRPNETIHAFRVIRPNDTMYTIVAVAMVTCPILTIVVPITLLIVFNSLLIYYMRMARHEVVNIGSLSTRKTSSNESKITRMVLIIVGTFCIFNLPSAVIFLYPLFDSTVNSSSVYLTVAATTNFLVAVHKVLNFPIYCCASKSYRQKLRRMLLAQRRQSQPPEHSNTQSGGNCI